MKKAYWVLFITVMLLTASIAVAENMGVQIIGGPDMETEKATLDDMKLDTAMEIKGYGIVLLTSFDYVDQLGHYAKGKHSVDGYDYYESGADADYALLKAEILNTAFSSKNLLANCEVKVVYDDVYEYGGWYRQYNWNNWVDDYSGYLNPGVQNMEWVIDREDQFDIGPLYFGHYVFGAALPNAVINSKKPLRMVITLDGNELTYHIRK